jgi:hypothetical protein
VQAHFSVLYDPPSETQDLAMEVEFKLTAAGVLVLKQARPWVN